MDIRSALMAIREESGVLTPELVVDAARPVDSLLHDRFEWDDAVAAEAHRREQAHEMIRAVRINYRAPSGELRHVRAFQAVRLPAQQTYAYVPSEEVAADPLIRDIVLADMRRQFLELHRRFGAFAEWSELLAETLAGV